MDEGLEKSHILAVFPPIDLIRIESESLMIAFGQEGLRNLIAHVDGLGIGSNARRAGAGIVEKAADPTRRRDLITIARAFPDISRTKMAAIGIRITHVLYYSEFPILKEVVHLGAARMQANLVVEPENALFCDAQSRTQTIVVGILERNYGIQTI